jgi:CheY-like chemotaxis protein
MLLDLELLQVHSLLDSSLSIIREKAASRNIRLTFDAAEEIGAMYGDARKVKQIVYNLLSNAVKFSGDGGQVTLGARVVARSKVGKLSGAWTGRSCPIADSEFTDFLELSVIDRGIGISEDGLEKLFQPFSQIDSGLARKFEGTGLGLAMVKLLAELHGGTVAVQSAVGEGSGFTVWLPLRATAGPARAPLSQHPLTLKGAPVALVVEHDVKSAQLIRLQLEAEGFDVLHADSGEAALALAVEQPLSLITLEIMLPDMDGWEFLARVKRMPVLSRIPVVIISILADRNKGFALGAAGVLEKPTTRQELMDALVELGLFPVSHGATLKVLVVDDDPKAVELIAVRLLDLASTVERAYGGREAIDAARSIQPDLIILDLMMPDVNGFDVVEALRGRSDTSGIPIMVVTAGEVTSEERAKLNGYVTTILAKTELEVQHFRSEVRRAMSGRQRVT